MNTRPIKQKGKVIDDLTLFKLALHNIDTYTNKTGEPPKIEPEFVQFMRDAVKTCEATGQSITQYKKAHVVKQFNNYDQICKNTDARNAKLEKKGAFELKTIEKIEGVADNDIDG